MLTSVNKACDERHNMTQHKLRRYLKHGMLPQLSVFEAVARHGNYTKAGEELFMAQPTVSVQMKKLTETVGTPLVEQIGKRIYLTEAGKLLYASCQEVFGTLQALDNKLANLGGLEFVAREIVEGFIAGLHRSPHRGFSVEFAEHRMYQPGDDLRYIDWRMFGRSDRYYIKQFEEETNLRAYLLLDISGSMEWTSAPGTRRKTP